MQHLMCTLPCTRRVLTARRSLGAGVLSCRSPRACCPAPVPKHALAFLHHSSHNQQCVLHTGHSLGAGVAAILGLLLKPECPSLECWPFAPPGGLLSPEVGAVRLTGEGCLVLRTDYRGQRRHPSALLWCTQNTWSHVNSETQDSQSPTELARARARAHTHTHTPQASAALAPFCISVVHAKDVVPRLSLGNVEKMVDACVELAALCKWVDALVLSRLLPVVGAW